MHGTKWDINFLTFVYMTILTIVTVVMDEFNHCEMS